MTAIEHKELKGITLRNMIVTIVSTASVVASVMTTYFQLKEDMRDIKARQEVSAKVYDIRLTILEGQVTVLQKQIDNLKSK